MDTLAIRTRARRKELKLSQPALARLVGVSTSAIQWVEYGRTKDPSFLMELARELGVEADWLRPLRDAPQQHKTADNGKMIPKVGNQNDVNVFIPPSAIMPDIGKLPYDFPLLGVAADSGAPDMFQIDWESGDKMRRPPGLEHISKAFATYVYGNHMYPRFDSGTKIAVNPVQPAAPGDDVIVEFRDADGTSSGRCVVKKLVSQNEEKVVVEQFSPARTDEYHRAEVARVMRIVPWPEVLGS